MDASTPLWKAHDISQKLQDTVEILPNVERAFVHVDHETTHTPVSTTTGLPTSISWRPLFRRPHGSLTGTSQGRVEAGPLRMYRYPVSLDLTNLMLHTPYRPLSLMIMDENIIHVLNRLKQMPLPRLNLLRLVEVVCVSDYRIPRGDPSLPAQRGPRLGVCADGVREYHRT